MARFKWHADYFEHRDGSARAARSEMIAADNADEAETIARAGMGACARVEVRRVATAAPVRVVYARAERDPRAAELHPLPKIVSLSPIGAGLAEMLS